jgi:hypothetical protein
MQIDPATHTTAEVYKLLTNLVVPRPIAWVTTQSASGVVNLAPFSFFNAVGSKPPYLVISVGANDDGSPKDTARNILENREFVVNLVTEDLFDAMNISAADFPPDRRAFAASAPAARGGRASEHRMQAVQRAAAGRQHALHRRSRDVPRRRPTRRPAPAHQQLRTDRPPGLALGLLPHDRSIRCRAHQLCAVVERAGRQNKLKTAPGRRQTPASAGLPFKALHAGNTPRQILESVRFLPQYLSEMTGSIYQ